MVNLKKLLTKIMSAMGVDHMQMRRYTIGTTFAIKQRPYARVAIVIPAYFSINSFRYKTYVRRVGAGDASMTIPMLPIDGGTYATEGTIDADVIIMRSL